jgi:acyl carrier protein
LRIKINDLVTEGDAERTAASRVVNYCCYLRVSMVNRSKIVEEIIEKIVATSAEIHPNFVSAVDADTDLYKAGLLDSLSLAHLIYQLEKSTGRKADVEKLFNQELKSPSQIATLFA